MVSADGSRRLRGETRVLVTGGAGYIGSHACKALAGAGLVPVAYDNLCRGHRWAVKWGPLVEGDIADRDLLLSVFREHAIEAVMHFGAYAYVGESMREPGRYFGNNVSGTLCLLEAMRTAGIGRIVFSSSCAIYGIPQALPILESHPQRPVNPYGESKLFVERALKWYRQAHGMRSVALRYFNAAGADVDAEIGEDHEPETHLIPLVLDAARGARPDVKIFGTDYPTPDGTAIRDYVHVADLADAHVSALSHLLADGDSLSLNLGTGHGYSVREVVAAVSDYCGTPIAVREEPRRPGDPPGLVADATRARRILNWQPSRSSLREIVMTAWRWQERQMSVNARCARAPSS